MPFQTALTERLGIAHPIIQAPMAGGGDTPELVIAVGEAGGLGSIAGAYRTPDQIAAVTKQVRAASAAPFSVNLFAPEPAPSKPDNEDAARAAVAGYYVELGLPVPGDLDEAGFRFEAQLEAALESGARVISFTFGIPPRDAIDAIKQREILLACTATSVTEARALAAAGADMIVAQGGEAGGHRGSFPGSAAHVIGTVALVPQIVDVVDVPVIASGGIMDGRGIAASLALGADAVQMGTVFLTTEEAGIPEAYKQVILDAREDETRITRAFSGRAARGIENRFLREVGEASAILPFPLQNALTRSLRKAAGERGRTEFLSLWAGQGLGLAKQGTAADLMANLVSGLDAAAARFRS